VYHHVPLLRLHRPVPRADSRLPDILARHRRPGDPVRVVGIAAPFEPRGAGSRDCGDRPARCRGVALCSSAGGLRLSEAQQTRRRLGPGRTGAPEARSGRVVLVAAHSTRHAASLPPRRRRRRRRRPSIACGGEGRSGDGRSGSIATGDGAAATAAASKLHSHNLHRAPARES
jgi:hypothetical protein